MRSLAARSEHQQGWPGAEQDCGNVFYIRGSSLPAINFPAFAPEKANNGLFTDRQKISLWNLLSGPSISCTVWKGYIHCMYADIRKYRGKRAFNWGQKTELFPRTQLITPVTADSIQMWCPQPTSFVFAHKSISKDAFKLLSLNFRTGALWKRN